MDDSLGIGMDFKTLAECLIERREDVGPMIDELFLIYENKPESLDISLDKIQRQELSDSAYYVAAKIIQHHVHQYCNVELNFYQNIVQTLLNCLYNLYESFDANNLPQYVRVYLDILADISIINLEIIQIPQEHILLKCHYISHILEEYSQQFLNAFLSPEEQDSFLPILNSASIEIMNEIETLPIEFFRIYCKSLPNSEEFLYPIQDKSLVLKGLQFDVPFEEQFTFIKTTLKFMRECEFNMPDIFTQVLSRTFDIINYYLSAIPDERAVEYINEIWDELLTDHKLHRLTFLSQDLSTSFLDTFLHSIRMLVNHECEQPAYIFEPLGRICNIINDLEFENSVINEFIHTEFMLSYLIEIFALLIDLTDKYEWFYTISNCAYTIFLISQEKIEEYIFCRMRDNSSNGLFLVISSLKLSFNIKKNILDKLMDTSAHIFIDSCFLILQRYTFDDLEYINGVATFLLQQFTKHSLNCMKTFNEMNQKFPLQIKSIITEEIIICFSQYLACGNDYAMILETSKFIINFLNHQDSLFQFILPALNGICTFIIECNDPSVINLYFGAALDILHMIFYKNSKELYEYGVENANYNVLTISILQQLKYLFICANADLQLDLATNCVKIFTEFDFVISDGIRQFIKDWIIQMFKVTPVPTYFKLLKYINETEFINFEFLPIDLDDIYDFDMMANALEYICHLIKKDENRHFTEPTLFSIIIMCLSSNFPEISQQALKIIRKLVPKLPNLPPENKFLILKVIICGMFQNIHRDDLFSAFNIIYQWVQMENELVFEIQNILMHFPEPVTQKEEIKAFHSMFLIHHSEYQEVDIIKMIERFDIWRVDLPYSWRSIIE